MGKVSVAIFLISIILLSFIVGYNVGLHNVEPQYYPLVETEVITVRDTITINNPIPQQQTKTKETVDTVIKYVTERDTVYIPIELPIIEKEYFNDKYKATVKGIEFGVYPALESLEIYSDDKVITNTIKVPKNAKKWGWNLSVGVGYGWDNNKNATPFVGVTCGYGFRL